MQQHCGLGPLAACHNNLDFQDPSFWLNLSRIGAQASVFARVMCSGSPEYLEFATLLLRPVMEQK